MTGSDWFAIALVLGLAGVIWWGTISRELRLQPHCDAQGKPHQWQHEPDGEYHCVKCPAVTNRDPARSWFPHNGGLGG